MIFITVVIALVLLLLLIYGTRKVIFTIVSSTLLTDILNPFHAGLFFQKSSL